jgi:P-type conjugative transfer protein TrbJ
MKRTLRVGLASISLIVFAVAPAQAQFFGSGIVFDPSNYAQNVLTATRALQQINNQIQGLQNQAMMLQNMANELRHLNFSSLAQMTGSLTQINALLNQASGIAFNLSATQAALAQNFPRSYDAALTGNQLVASAETNWNNTMSAFRQTMQVQSQVVANIQSDQGLLSDLVTQSQGAVGNLQAEQATNQLLVLSAKQQFQLEAMIAAQYRADALDRARQAQTEEQARLATKAFIGSGNAYTPQ